MARVCTVCGKGYMASWTRSHSMRKTKVRLYPNLQWMKMDHGQRVKACVKCMKTQAKRMALATA